MITARFLFEVYDITVHNPDVMTQTDQPFASMHKHNKPHPRPEWDWREIRLANYALQLARTGASICLRPGAILPNFTIACDNCNAVAVPQVQLARNPLATAFSAGWGPGLTTLPHNKRDLLCPDCLRKSRGLPPAPAPKPCTCSMDDGVHDFKCAKTNNRAQTIQDLNDLGMNVIDKGSIILIETTPPYPDGEYQQINGVIYRQVNESDLFAIAQDLLEAKI